MMITMMVVVVMVTRMMYDPSRNPFQCKPHV